MPDFRTQIRKAMKKQKMSGYKLAHQVNLNPNTVYRYLEGKTQITVGNLERILSVLQIEKF